MLLEDRASGSVETTIAELDPDTDHGSSALFGFDGVMLTVANDHWVHVVMLGLFDFGPGRPAQRVDEEEPGCLTTELLPPDLLLGVSVGVGCRQ